MLAPAQVPPEPGDGSAKATLDRAIAEVDRLDPGWRLEDLEAHRARPVSARDSAVVLRATRDRLSVPTSLEKEALGMAIGDESGDRLDATARMVLSGFVERNRAVLPALRSLVDRPTGRFDLSTGKNWLEIPLPHLQPLREQVRLLLADAVLRLDGGDADGAMDSCRAAISAARSLLDEPIILSQFVRVACDAQIQETILRVLAAGRPSEPALALIQRLIMDEVDWPITLVGVRGERAFMFDTYRRLADGTLTLEEFFANADAPRAVPPPGLQDHLIQSGSLRTMQRPALELMTRLVDVYRQPSWTWHEGIGRFDQMLGAVAAKERGATVEMRVAGMLLPATSSLLHGELRTDALGRSLVLLIAAKRHAMILGRWPSSAEALVPRFLAAVPTDPMTGRPMRLVMKGGKLIAYSLGIDGRDDGGSVAGSSRRVVEKSVDVGFELSIPGAG
jgi:hypothetical protein